MDRTITEEVQESVEFGGGLLILQITMERHVDSYGRVPTVLAKTLHFQDRTGKPVLIKDIKELKFVSEIQGIDLTKEAASRPAEMACLLAELESLGTVLLPTWRYAVFHEKYGIDLKSNQPRVEGSKLRFLVVDLRIQSADHILRDTEVDFSDMKVSAKDVMAI